jgi:hypothetical protein
MDFDWAVDKIRHQSVTGYFFKLANSIIFWHSHAQKTIALTLTEAEYMAISNCSQQAIWIKTLIEELGIHKSSSHLWWQPSSIFIANNPAREPY